MSYKYLATIGGCSALLSTLCIALLVIFPYFIFTIEVSAYDIFMVMCISFTIFFLTLIAIVVDSVSRPR